MDSLPRRTGKLPIGHGHFSAVPTFGQDYRKVAQTKSEVNSISSSSALVQPNIVTSALAHNASLPSSHRDTHGQTEFWSRDPSNAGRGASPAIMRRHANAQLDATRRPKSIEPPDPRVHPNSGWLRPESRSGSSEADSNRRLGRGLPRPDSMYLPQTNFGVAHQPAHSGLANEAEHARNLEKSFLNLNLRPEPSYGQSSAASTWGAPQPQHLQQQQHQKQQQPAHPPSQPQQQPYEMYRQNDRAQPFADPYNNNTTTNNNINNNTNNNNSNGSSSSLQTPQFYLLSNANSNNNISDMSTTTTTTMNTATNTYQPQLQPYDPNSSSATITSPTFLLCSAPNQPIYNNNNIPNYAPQQQMPTAIPAPTASYALMPNPVSAISGPIQPQIAIVATDPATLRALLSGSLAPQNLFQSLMMPQQQLQQPQQQQFQQQQQQQLFQQQQQIYQSPQPAASALLPQSRQLQQHQQQYQPPPSPQQQQPQQHQYHQQYQEQQLPQQQQRYQAQQQQKPAPQQQQRQKASVDPMFSHSSAGHLHNGTDAHATHRSVSAGSVQSSQAAVNNSTGSSHHPRQSGPVQHAASQMTSSVGSARLASDSRVVEPPGSHTHPDPPDVITRSRHCTSATRKPLTKSHTIAYQEEATPDEQEDSEMNNLPRIGHPPRTVRQLAKPDLLEGSLGAEETRHSVAVREPRKLNAEAFLEQSLRRVSDIQTSSSTVGTAVEAWDTGDSDTLGRRRRPAQREPNSISAYYEKMKQQQQQHQQQRQQKGSPRPLSAYRSTEANAKRVERPSLIQSPALRVGSKPSATETALATAAAESSMPVRRAVTFAAESATKPHEESEVPAQAVRDPTLMSVAERARQWIEGREREQNERNRYSTCGFIDQDLIDCQELVPVEDRVKMFDSGNLTQSVVVETDARAEPSLQGPTTNRSPNTTAVAPAAPLRVEPHGQTPSRAVASMQLQASKATLANAMFPRATVGLQRLRFGTPATAALTKPTGTNASIKQSGTGERPSPTQTDGDELTRMTVQEKRRLFTRDKQAQPAEAPRTTTPRLATRRKTQPVTLDDLARANQLILARLDGRITESPPASICRGDDLESFGFQERISEISTPEASVVSF